MIRIDDTPNISGIKHFLSSEEIVQPNKLHDKSANPNPTNMNEIIQKTESDLDYFNLNHSSFDQALNAMNDTDTIIPALGR